MFHIEISNACPYYVSGDIFYHTHMCDICQEEQASVRGRRMDASKSSYKYPCGLMKNNKGLIETMMSGTKNIDSAFAHFI